MLPAPQNTPVRNSGATEATTSFFSPIYTTLATSSVCFLDHDCDATPVASTFHHFVLSRLQFDDGMREVMAEKSEIDLDFRAVSACETVCAALLSCEAPWVYDVQSLDSQTRKKIYGRWRTPFSRSSSILFPCTPQKKQKQEKFSASRNIWGNTTVKAGSCSVLNTYSGIWL